MCGIAGIIALPEGRPPSRAELECMIGTLRHRGPDGFGYFQSGPVGFAHARLRIIDLLTGDQPIANENRTIWTVFNGEIFNYVELREDLEKAGHTFHTQSDTETIVHAYEQWGDEFVLRLNGQFAIALWDAPRRRLLLIRDRTGIRPLFVHRDGQRLLFGSEIKAVLAVSKQPRRLDLAGLSQVFTFWSTVGQRTAFEGVKAVPPGCMIAVEDGRETLSQYWTWSFPAREDCVGVSFDEAAEQLRSLLTDAVRLQLRADVPVGAYLSGGLDSAIIANLIRQNTDVPLRTFSVTFEGAEFDESEYQRVMVDHLGAEHTSVPCTQAEIGAAFHKLIQHTETPIVRTAPAPLMILSELVRQSGFRVVLTGEGADEVFGGYDLFKEAKIRRFWACQPRSRWRPALLSRLYPYLRHSPVASPAYAQSFYGQGIQDVASPYYAHMQRWRTTSRLHTFLSADAKQSLQSYLPENDLSSMLPLTMDRWSGLSRDQFVEANTLLCGYLLSSQGDRVAMANSVEGRVPFLDHRVVEFANSLPAKFKLRGLREKAVLRESVRDLLPERILNRVKQPYRSPDSRSFFSGGPGEEIAAAMLTPTRIRDAGYFDSKTVQRLVEKCRAGKAIGFTDNMAFVGILSTMLVHELFVRQNFAFAA